MNNSGFNCPGLLGGAKSCVSKQMYFICEGYPFKALIYLDSFQRDLYLEISKENHLAIILLLILMNYYPTKPALSSFWMRKQVTFEQTKGLHDTCLKQVIKLHRNCFQSLEPPASPRSQSQRSMNIHLTGHLATSCLVKHVRNAMPPRVMSLQLVPPPSEGTSTTSDLKCISDRHLLVC